MTAPPTVGVRPAEGLREQLSTMRALLALSMLMTEVSDEDGIFELVAEALPAMTCCHLAGIYLDEGRWKWPRSGSTGPALGRHLEERLLGLGRMGGALDIPAEPWAWAFPMRSITGHAGYLVVGSSAEPPAHEQFYLRVLAQQTALALSNAWWHSRERASSEQLADTNARLSETVASLRRGMELHERLTEVVASGLGVEGIARAVHERTGLGVIIEDRHGQRQAAVGEGAATYRLTEGRRRDSLVQRALEHSRPLRADSCWVALARARTDVLGILVLIDPEETVGEQELMALEYGATVLAMEFAHQQSLAEVELRLRRDIAEDLLAGSDERSVLLRARALDYDLDRPHRIVVVEPPGQVRIEDLFKAVRRAAFREGAGSLLVARADTVVLLAHSDGPWLRLHEAIVQELGARRCRIGVGSACTRPKDFPRSHREARFALRLQSLAQSDRPALCYEDLGVFRIFSTVSDPADLGALVSAWLEELLQYDVKHHYDLVETLSAYLENGGNHAQTANAVRVHRSTLKYRLKRIREISGHDLTDPDTRFHLQLATRAWRTLEALR